MNPSPTSDRLAERVQRTGSARGFLALVFAVLVAIGVWCHRGWVGGAARGAEPSDALAGWSTAGDVRGRVVDLEGLPVGGAKVVVWAEAGGEVLRLGRGTSDPSGRFVVSEFLATDLLAADGLGSGSEPGDVQWWATVQARGWRSGDAHPLDPARGVAILELAPETASRVLFGRVHCGKDDRVAAPRSRVVILDGDGYPVAHASTDADGRFVLRGSLLGRGDLCIVAHHPRHGMSRFVAVPEVGRGTTARLELRLERALASLEGIVLTGAGEPVAGREFLLCKVDRAGVRDDADDRRRAAGPFPEIPVRSGSDGSILVRGLEAGEYELRLAAAPEIRTRVSTGASRGSWRLPRTDP